MYERDEDLQPTDVLLPLNGSVRDFQVAVNRAAEQSNVAGVATQFRRSGKIYAYNHKAEQGREIYGHEDANGTAEFIPKDDAKFVLLTALVPEAFSPTLLAKEMSSQFNRNIQPANIRMRKLGEVETSEFSDIPQPDSWRVVEIPISTIEKAEKKLGAVKPRGL